MLFATSAWRGGLLSVHASPLSLSNPFSDRYGPKIEPWHRESDISRPIYITRPSTRLPYVRSVHMYACIARRLASRSSFRYPFASRLFEGTTATGPLRVLCLRAASFPSASLLYPAPIGQLPELAITTSAIFFPFAGPDRD